MDDFDRVYALLEASNRFLSQDELLALLDTEVPEETWEAATGDPRFSGSIVRQGARGQELRYQTLGRAAERMAHLLKRFTSGLKREEICRRLRLRVSDEAWSNLVKRLRFQHHLEVEERPGRASLYRIAEPTAPPPATVSEEAPEPPSSTPEPPELEPTLIPTRLGVGAEVLGRYTLSKVIAETRYGTVYGANRIQDDGRMIVKVAPLLDDSGSWSEHHEPFLRTSQLLQSLDHPNVPRIYEGVLDEELGVALRVEEPLLGGDLESRILDTHARLSPEDFRHLARDLLAILDHLHTRLPLIVHRSLQPAHIMFRNRTSWMPLLADFHAAANPTALAESAYAAPEAFTDAPPAPQSDLYSLGLVLLFVATHRQPDALPRTRKDAVDLEALPEIAHLEPDMRKLVEGLLHIPLKKRLGSASEALELLQPKTPKGSTALVRRADSDENMLTRVKREGWLAQTAPDARNYWLAAYVFSLIFFFPVTALATLGYVIWRKS